MCSPNDSTIQVMPPERRRIGEDKVKSFLTETIRTRRTSNSYFLCLEFKSFCQRRVRCKMKLSFYVLFLSKNFGSLGTNKGKRKH